MKARYALFSVAALLMPAFAGTPEVVSAAPIAAAAPAQPKCEQGGLTGSLTFGYESNYVGRGIVISHSVAEGDSVEYAALKLNYDIGKKSYWSFDSIVSYKVVSSGHVLYGPKPYDTMALKGKYVAPKNVENEFSVVTGARYTGKYASIAFGHQFVHGGLLGAMAKHFRHQGASNVNELFVNPSVTPTKWLEAGVTVRYSFQGIQGWWYEPYVTFKAPIIRGDNDDIKMAGLLTFAVSSTSDYFENEYGACTNGAQAWWIKLATPYFASKNLVITPSISFNWLGNGAQHANRVAAFKQLNSSYVPFRNFGVVAGVSCSYVF